MGRDGALLAGAIVAAPQPIFHREEPPQVRTDARGEFRLGGLDPTKPVRLFAYTADASDGFADVVAEPKPDGSSWTELRLEQREPVRVHVEDNSGRPLAGGLIQWSTRPKQGPLWRTMTVLDDAGDAVLARYPNQRLSGAVSAIDSSRTLATLTFEPGDRLDLRVRVEPDECAQCARLSLTVLDHRGAPLHGAVLVMFEASEPQPVGWIFDPSDGRLTARKLTPGTEHWFVVAREGALDLGRLTLTEKGDLKLGKVSCGLPGSVEISRASAPPTAARLAVYYTADGGVGFVRDLALDATSVELLPHAYEIRLESERGELLSRAAFTVTSGVVTRVVIP
jgi:hypothetical protein